MISEKTLVFSKGYPSRNERQQNITPRNLILEFLNTDTSKLDQVIYTCNKLKLFLPYKPDYLTKVFKKEQDLMRFIIAKLNSKTITQNDLDKVNKRIRGMTERLELLGVNSAIKVNRELEDYPKDLGEYADLNEIKSKSFIHKVKVRPGLSLLWEEFSEFIILKQKVKNCSFCGIYYSISNSRPNKEYCSIECKNKGTKKRIRANKRLPTQSPSKVPPV